MPNLKKVISLHQASNISGYHQDYLSALIRKGEIKGEKLGGSWFTTFDEIESYIFKQKIRNKNWLVRYFLSFTRANSSFIYAFIFLVILSTGIYFYNKISGEINAQKVNAENSQVNKFITKEALEKINIKELKF